MAYKTYTTTPMIPGPTTVPEKILEAMSQDYGSGQIDHDFLELYARVGKKTGTLMATTNDVVIMTGEGMLALWGALKSCLKAGDAVVSVGTGVFGDGIGEMAASIGCKVEAISLPYDEVIDAAALEKIDAAVKKVQPTMLTAVHCETPSGTLNPLYGLAEIKKRHNVPLFYVDAVASAGGAPVNVDACAIDLALVGSQKCLSAPPSMSLVAVSDAAWEYMERVQYQGYDSIRPFRTVQQDGRCPYTPYWHGVAALEAALSLIEAEGIDTVYARHETVARMCREGLAALGIRLFPKSGYAPTVTAAYVPEGITFAEWQARLKMRGLTVSGSFGPMAGKVFRLGHMGAQATPELVHQALEIIKESMP